MFFFLKLNAIASSPERAAAEAMAAAIAAENEFYSMTAGAQHSDEDGGELPERATPRKRQHVAEERDERERVELLNVNWKQCLLVFYC